MKRINLKLIVFTMSFLVSFGIVFASEEVVIKNIATTFLDIFTWFAYAIALGCLMFFGIKYMMSSANEKANLKGMLPKYLIGIALIILCFTIASGVANMTGNDTAEEIIGVGENAGNHFSGGTSQNGNLPLDNTASNSTSTTHESSSGRTHGGSSGKGF